MRRSIKYVLSVVASVAVAGTFLQAPVVVATAEDLALGTETEAEAEAAPPHADDLPHPLGDKQRALRQEAVERVLKGKAKPEKRGESEVVKLAPGQYAEYGVEKTDRIFTILAEFGTAVEPALGGAAGPRAGQISAPDRDWDGSPTDDNISYWKPAFDRQHYLDLFFGASNSMADFYRRQSSGRYDLTGDVSDWVALPYNEARYGSNKRSTSMTYWPFVRDTVAAWYESERAAGKTDAEIAAYLSPFDSWDRYDHDSDGNFDEPDGYVDHFQAVHAGEAEEAGGGAQGADAIWSHRWYAYQDDIGRTGPAWNRAGGVPIGNTGIWVGDYTTEPENGGLGVFVHEYGHDLGLPDLYDTSGGNNGTGHWTAMSVGSWLSRGGADNIGTAPNYFGPWEKLVLGWLDYEVVPFGADTTVDLGVSAQRGKKAQAVAVLLPDDVVAGTRYNTPYSGSYEWWSGRADNLNSTLTRTLDLTGATSASLTAKGWYDLETDFDFAYAEVSTDGGSNWAQVGTRLNGRNVSWQDLTYDLTPYAGRTVQFRFRYQTDASIIRAGLFLDDISLLLDGAAAWFDDVESGVSEWTAAGWSRTTGSDERRYARYYLAENRQYVGYDETLRDGPFNFGWDTLKPKWVERFPYQNGLLVWYVNTREFDNNTRMHPGTGLVLPVDARPATMRNADGSGIDNTRQAFDATFGLEPTDPVTFHRNGVPTTFPAQPAIRTFDDSDPNRYWVSDNPLHSVRVAGTGTSITVRAQNNDGAIMIVDVAFR